MFERLIDIILPVFSVIVLGYVYARRAKPDMSNALAEGISPRPGRVS